MSSKMLGKLNLNHDLIQQELDVIAYFPVIPEIYSEFGTGTWINHSLWNESGDYRNTQYQSYSLPIQVTALGAKLPYINTLIKNTVDTKYLKMVRVRNLINGLVLPHKDYVELDGDKRKYLRVFIPLEDNSEAYHSDEYSVFQMRKGEVWLLDASIIHAAANFSTNSRIHLCLDFQFPEPCPPESVFLDKDIFASLVSPTLPIRSPYYGLQSELKRLATKITTHNILDVLVDLSKLHFHYDVSISECYNWLITVAQSSKREDVWKKCLRLENYMIGDRTLGERFSFNDSALLEVV